GEDPIVAQIKQLSAELAEVRETSKRLAEETARAKRQQLIAEVAAAKGLTLDQARRLQGETREELEADADELVALFGLNRRREPAPKPKPHEKKPLRGGATNDSDEERLFGGRSRREILEAVTSTGRQRRCAARRGLHEQQRVPSGVCYQRVDFDARRGRAVGCAVPDLSRVVGALR